MGVCPVGIEVCKGTLTIPIPLVRRDGLSRMLLDRFDVTLHMPFDYEWWGLGRVSYSLRPCKTSSIGRKLKLRPLSRSNSRGTPKRQRCLQPTLPQLPKALGWVWRRIPANWQVHSDQGVSVYFPFIGRHLLHSWLFFRTGSRRCTDVFVPDFWFGGRYWFHRRCNTDNTYCLDLLGTLPDLIQGLSDTQVTSWLSTM
jgi:hypothetical protein